MREMGQYMRGADTAVARSNDVRHGRRAGTRRLLRASAPAALVAVAGVLYGATAGAQTYDVAMSLPSSVEVQDIVLGSTSNLRVETFSNVEGGAHSRIVNMGSLTTGISFGAKTGDVLSVASVTLEIPNISGNVTSEGTVISVFGTTVGTVTQHAQLGRKAGPTVHVEFPATSSGSINVLPLLTQTLSPGRYANLNVSPGGTLSLRTGTYYFDTYIIDPAATVVVDESAGPVEIYVKTTLQHMGRYKTPSGGAPNVFIGYFGIVPAYVGASFPGTVLAPSAQLVIGTQLGGTTHVGAFFASGIDVLPATTIKHRASDRWGIGGNAVIPRLPGAVIITDPAPPSSPSFTGTTTTNNGTTYVTGIHYKTPDPAHGVAAPRFCTANDVPIASPTDAQLNAPPPPGSTCPAMAPNTTNCPIDPASVTATACSTDSDCGAGYICGTRCTDSSCLNVEHRCGKPSESCGGLPAQSNCEEYYICPEDGATGTPDPAETAAQLPVTSALNNDTGVIHEADKTAVPAYASLSLADQELCTPPAPNADVREQSDGTNKPVGDGQNTKKKKWGVFFTPTTDFSISPHLDATKYGDLAALKGELGFHAGGIVWGHPVEVLGADAKSVVDSCGVTITATVKLFGEAVYAWTPGAAQQNHLASKPENDGIETPKNDKKACTDSRKLIKDTIHDIRLSNVRAREVIEYYKTKGLTPELCEDIQHELGSKLDPDPSTGKPVDCRALEGKDPAVHLNILNAWKKEYDTRTKSYLDVSTDLGVKQDTIQTSGTIDLKLSKRHPYDLKILDQDFQIAFVTLNLAIEGYGFWDVNTGIQYGVGFSGNFTGVTDILKNTVVNGTPLRIGDIRAYAGPIVTPEAGVGVLAYVGVGIPGVSVGIQGQLDLLDVALPTTVVAAVQRVSTDDTRDRNGTPYTGNPKPGLLGATYQWQTGFRLCSTLNLTELKGEIDLAARLHFFGFHKTFKHKLAGFNGFTQSFPLVSGSSGDISSGGDYGKQGDNQAYTEIAPVEDSLTGTGVILSPAGPHIGTCYEPPLL